jgi:hypothetical protein
MKWVECPICGEELVFEVCACGASDEHRTAQALRNLLPKVLGILELSVCRIESMEKKMDETNKTE